MRRQHRGDERQPVRGAGDVAVREPRVLVAARPQAPARGRRADVVACRGERDLKWLDMLAFDDRQICRGPFDPTFAGSERTRPASRPKRGAVVARVELRPKLIAQPAGLPSGRKSDAARSTMARSVAVRSDGSPGRVRRSARSARATGAPEMRGRVVADRFEVCGVVEIQTAGDFIGRRPRRPGTSRNRTLRWIGKTPRWLSMPTRASTQHSDNSSRRSAALPTSVASPDGRTRPSRPPRRVSAIARSRNS